MVFFSKSAFISVIFIQVNDQIMSRNVGVIKFNLSNMMLFQYLRSAQHMVSSTQKKWAAF